MMWASHKVGMEGDYQRAEAVGRVRPQLQWEDCGRVMRKVEEDVLTSSWNEHRHPLLCWDNGAWIRSIHHCWSCVLHWLAVGFIQCSSQVHHFHLPFAWSIHASLKHCLLLQQTFLCMEIHSVIHRRINIKLICFIVITLIVFLGTQWCSNVHIFLRGSLLTQTLQLFATLNNVFLCDLKQ